MMKKNISTNDSNHEKIKRSELDDRINSIDLFNNYY